MELQNKDKVFFRLIMKMSSQVKAQFSFIGDNSKYPIQYFERECGISLRSMLEVSGIPVQNIDSLGHEKKLRIKKRV